MKKLSAIRIIYKLVKGYERAIDTGNTPKLSHKGYCQLYRDYMTAYTARVNTFVVLPEIEF